MQTFSGGCNCGGVRYEFEAESLGTGVCHCQTCQRQTGTSFSILTIVAESTVRYTSDKTLKSYVSKGDSGEDVIRQFCGECGSPILSLPKAAPGMAILKAGTLDNAREFEPAMHMFVEDAQSWFQLEKGLPQFPQMPPAG